MSPPPGQVPLMSARGKKKSEFNKFAAHTIPEEHSSGSSSSESDDDDDDLCTDKQ